MILHFSLGLEYVHGELTLWLVKEETTDRFRALLEGAPIGDSGSFEGVTHDKSDPRSGYGKGSMIGSSLSKPP